MRAVGSTSRIRTRFFFFLLVLFLVFFIDTLAFGFQRRGWFWFGFGARVQNQFTDILTVVHFLHSFGHLRTTVKNIISTINFIFPATEGGCIPTGSHSQSSTMGFEVKMFFFSSPVKSEKVDLGIPFLYSSIQMKEKKKKAEFVD